MAGLAANDPTVILDGTRSGTGGQRSGRVDAGRGVERSRCAGSRGESRRRGVDGDDGRRRSCRRIHRESRHCAGGERELRQLRAGDGRGGTGLLQQPVGAGGKPGNERLCGLGRCGCGRLLSGYGHDGIGGPPSTGCAVRPIPHASAERSSTKARTLRSTGPTANSAGYGSALGYIPEEVWNESALDGGTGLWASGGGASAVYAQPAWQAERERSRRGERDEGSAGCCAVGRGPRRLFHGGERIELDCLRHLGGVAVRLRA